MGKLILKIRVDSRVEILNLILDPVQTLIFQISNKSWGTMLIYSTAKLII